MQVCSAFKTGMGCIEEYANQCLSPRDHKVLEDHVAGAKHTFRFLCDDPGFQKDYLRYTTCYRGISVDWDACANRFVQLVREEMIRKNVSEQSRLLELCCAKHGFLKCVYTASRLKCRQEEALFLNKIAETLSNMRVYSPMCTHIETQLCGTSHGSCSTPLILAAILLLTLYRLRYDLCLHRTLTYSYLQPSGIIYLDHFKMLCIKIRMDILRFCESLFQVVPCIIISLEVRCCSYGSHHTDPSQPSTLPPFRVSLHSTGNTRRPPPNPFNFVACYSTNDKLSPLFSPKSDARF